MAQLRCVLSWANTDPSEVDFAESDIEGVTTSAPSGAPRNKIDPPPLDAARALAIRDILRSGLPWLLTDEQVAHMLGTTPRAVRRLRENKKIPYVRVGGRFARINLADVMAYVESRRIPAATKTTE